MAIWTSRYSNKELQNGNYYCVGISLGSPRFPLGFEVREQCYSLAPKGYMLKMDYEPYRAAYIKKLEDIGTDRILDMVMRFDQKARAEGKELVFLCYEDVRNAEDWCHRTIFAQWYMEKTGEIIKELPDPNPPKGKKPAKKTDRKEPARASEPPKSDNGFEQMSLFSMAGMTI